MEAMRSERDRDPRSDRRRPRPRRARAARVVGDDDLLGLATLRPDGPDCELVTLARERGCRRLWLVTSNDNLDALRFYHAAACDS